MSVLVEQLTSLVDASELVMPPNAVVELLARQLLARDHVAARCLSQAIETALAEAAA
jgi:hypothetical protein